MRPVVAGPLVGIAVPVLLAVPLAWGPLVLAVVLACTVLVARPWRQRLGAMLLLEGCIASGLVAAVGGLLTALLRQPWLPIPVMVSLAVLALVLGALAVLVSDRSMPVARRSPAARAPDH
jgi:hypothetical protein